MTDVFTKEKRSEVMSRIRSKWTGPEREFRRAHPDAVPHPRLPHNPDFCFPDGRVVFLDSPFWHCRVPRAKYERLPAYWRGKLFRNLVRDLCADAFWSAVGNYERGLTGQRGARRTDPSLSSPNSPATFGPLLAIMTRGMLRRSA